MSNSSLATVHYWTANYGYENKKTGAPKAGRYGYKIDKIFVHHMAIVNGTALTCYNGWKTREGSAHYAISCKGEIGQLVDEANVAWHCGNKAYNCRSVAIELANDKGAKGDWHIPDKAIKVCIDLIVDICQRNGITKINYTGDLKGNLCMHRMVVATACPGPYMVSANKMQYIANEVNKKLGQKPSPAPDPKPAKKTWLDYKTPFLVRVSCKDLYIRKGPGIANYGRQKVDGSVFIKPGVYTIVAVEKAEGYYWGKLKSSTEKSPRWIALDYTEYVR